MGITEVVTAPRSPWQNAYVERVIGSIYRECLDHVIVFNERHLRRVMIAYLHDYHCSRTHLSLAKDCPDPRPIRTPNHSKVIAFAQVGGLHHRFDRLAAQSTLEDLLVSTLRAFVARHATRAGSVCEDPLRV